jgi:hypothetical protein
MTEHYRKRDDLGTVVKMVVFTIAKWLKKHKMTEQCHRKMVVSTVARMT